MLISGRGSNLQALIDAVADGTLEAQIAVVISNKPSGRTGSGAGGGHRDARPRSSRVSRRVTTTTPRSRRRSSARGVSLVCLAGFMRLIGPPLLEAFPNAILNVHPSLLPAFPGVDAQRQALEHGVKISGATVHLVTASSTADRSCCNQPCRCATTTPSMRCPRGS